MIQINTKAFADEFCSMLEALLKQFDYVGEKRWGDPSGVNGLLETYEITANHGKAWCALDEYGYAGEVNRKGIVIDFASENKSFANPVATVFIPYDFSKRFYTRAYNQDNYYEIRNYGRFTVGRKPLKQKDFFDYVQKNYPELVFHDEENKLYIKAYHYRESMDKETFAEQTFSFLKLISDFKKQYR